METLVVRRSLPRTALWFLAAFALAPLGATLALGGFGAVELPAKILGWASVVFSLIGMARMGWQRGVPGDPAVAPAECLTNGVEPHVG
jgi:hypothetical protein